jgi:hypothetical protein
LILPPPKKGAAVKLTEILDNYKIILIALMVETSALITNMIQDFHRQVKRPYSFP